MHRRNNKINLAVVCLGLLVLFGPLGALHAPVALQVLVGVLAVWAVVGVIVLWRLMDRAATQSLGIKVGLRNGRRPPRNNATYESWCHELGLTPYAAE